MLLLAGVILSAFFQAMILLLLTFANVESFRSAIFWMMGSFAGSSWRAVLLLGAYVLPASIVLFALARPFNLLSTGEEAALYLGVRVEAVTRSAYFIASVLVGASVCSLWRRRFRRPDHTTRSAYDLGVPITAWFCQPASSAGALFLVLCDTAAPHHRCACRAAGRP